MFRLPSFAALALTASASVILPRQDSSNTAFIDFSVDNGAPQHLAAGVLYGIPGGFPGMNPDQIPDSLYAPFNYFRSGGAQMTQGGWVTGLDGYEARFQNMLSDYKTARGLGAPIILLNHDIWGTDHANSSTVWPGDNGDFSAYDDYLDHLLSDIKSNNMVDGLVFDIWNEPDGGYFWIRSQDQYLQMWAHTYDRIRSDSALSPMLISGPSMGDQPGDDWYNTYIQFIVQNNSIPDQYSWHDEFGDPQNDVAAHNSVIAKYGAPARTININEYATYDEQVAAGSAWFISSLERVNAIGLRGNWLSKCQLHDFLASTLTKSDTNSCGASDYSPNGDWWVYDYYTRNMTGHRAGTTRSGDENFEVYSTVGDDGTVRIITGVINSQTGTWYITLNNLQSLGLPDSGTLNIQTYGLIDAGHFNAVTAPTNSNRGIYGHPYSGGTVTFPIFQTQEDVNTAWIFEFQY